MYVRCIAGCQSLFTGERITLPPVGDVLGDSSRVAGAELKEGGRVGPLEGSAAKMSVSTDWSPPDPPEEFFRDLWEGGDHGAR